jgi:Ca2+-binding RTX toxin-like protein
VTDRREPLDPTKLAQISGGCAGVMPNLIIGDDKNGVIRGTAGNDIIDARGGHDWVEGGAGADLINGGAGDDYLFGDAGNDVVHGGAGDDVILWKPGDGNDQVYGGQGSDWLVIAGVFMSPEELLACIVVEEGSPPPRLGADGIDLTGVRGVIVFGEERITFEGLEQVRLIYW